MKSKIEKRQWTFGWKIEADTSIKDKDIQIITCDDDKLLVGIVPNTTIAKHIIDLHNTYLNDIQNDSA